MTNDVISRFKVLKFLNRMEENVMEDDYISKAAKITIECTRDYIAAIPSIDAVPVVRCRDCKNWESDWKPDIFVQDPPRHYCAINDCFLTGDWFCAAGERIEVDNNK